MFQFKVFNVLFMQIQYLFLFYAFFWQSLIFLLYMELKNVKVNFDKNKFTYVPYVGVTTVCKNKHFDLQFQPSFQEVFTLFCKSKYMVL